MSDRSITIEAGGIVIVEVTCHLCAGRCTIGDQWCWECGGNGALVDWFDASILIRNIAVAGALTKAWRLGDQHGYCIGDWKPNVDGRAAP